MGQWKFNSLPNFLFLWIHSTNILVGHVGLFFLPIGELRTLLPCTGEATKSSPGEPPSVLPGKPPGAPPFPVVLSAAEMFKIKKSYLSCSCAWFLDEVVDKTIIKIFSIKMGITSIDFDFENTLLDGEKGDVESLHQDPRSRRCIRQQLSCQDRRQ